MAKLQKTLKQRHRHAVRNSAHVAKLTPAEIRSLNNDALSSKTGSQSSSKSATTPSRSRRSTNGTPPASPDEPSAYQAQTHRHSVPRNNSINVPTPPHTPNAHRRSSQSSTHGHHHQSHGVAHAHAKGVIHAPQPRGSAQAAFMSANGISSRPSSSESSTYRGLPTYRGPEVTRTGSINMLPHPSQQIVTNPLSFFSRPRQSQVSTSPERCRRGSQEISTYRTQSLRNARANSLPNVSAPPSRPVSPPRATDSPVSMIVDETEKFPVLDPEDDPHNQPKIQSYDETPQDVPKLEAAENHPQDEPVLAEEQPKQIDLSESAKKAKDKQKRFTIHAALFGGDKGKNESAENKLKKTRRRTLELPKSEDSQTAEDKCEAAEASVDVKADCLAGEPGDYSAHPAVRPLSSDGPSANPASRPISLIIPGEFKGKEKEIISAPVYARCSCCGKIRKPHAFNSELSPVLENENLRTNFSFEVERTNGPSGRRSSNASRDKFTPIIPIEVAPNETRQATIEPYNTSPEDQPKQRLHRDGQHKDMEIAQSSPVRQPLGQMTSSPITSKRHSAPARFVRFASLHGRRSEDTDAIIEEDEEDEEEDVEANENETLMGEQVDFSNEYGTKVLDFATMPRTMAVGGDVAQSRADMDPSSASRVVVEPISAMTDHDIQLVTSQILRDVPRRPSTEQSSEVTSLTPARGPTHAVENQAPPPIQYQSTTQFDRARQPLPEPSFHFQTTSPPQPPANHQDSSPTITISETPTSSVTTTTTTTISPHSAATSTSTATSISTPPGSAWEAELSGTFLGGGGGAMDLSLRPKFSFESMRSAMNAVEKGMGNARGSESGRVLGEVGVDAGGKDGAKAKPTGKRKSSLGPGSGWMGVMAVKA